MWPFKPPSTYEKIRRLKKECGKLRILYYEMYSDAEIIENLHAWNTAVAPFDAELEMLFKEEING